jgi:hypothetical protein
LLGRVPRHARRERRWRWKERRVELRGLARPWSFLRLRRPRWRGVELRRGLDLRREVELRRNAEHGRIFGRGRELRGGFGVRRGFGLQRLWRVVERQRLGLGERLRFGGDIERRDFRAVFVRERLADRLGDAHHERRRQRVLLALR